MDTTRYEAYQRDKWIKSHGSKAGSNILKNNVIANKQEDVSERTSHGNSNDKQSSLFIFVWHPAHEEKESTGTDIRRNGQQLSLQISESHSLDDGGKEGSEWSQRSVETGVYEGCHPVFVIK